MNNYPALPIQYGSKLEWIRRTQTDVATDGSVRIRVLDSRRRALETLVHPNLTRAERDALLAFYDANVAQPVLLDRIRDGIPETRTVLLIGPPTEVYVKGSRYTMTQVVRDYQ